MNTTAIAKAGSIDRNIGIDVGKVMLHIAIYEVDLWFPLDPIMRAISSSENPTSRPGAISARRSNMLALKTRRKLYSSL